MRDNFQVFLERAHPEFLATQQFLFHIIPFYSSIQRNLPHLFQKLNHKSRIIFIQKNWKYLGNCVKNDAQKRVKHCK